MRGENGDRQLYTVGSIQLQQSPKAPVVSYWGMRGRGKDSCPAGTDEP